MSKFSITWIHPATCRKSLWLGSQSSIWNRREMLSHERKMRSRFHVTVGFVLWRRYATGMSLSTALDHLSCDNPCEPHHNGLCPNLPNASVAKRWCFNCFGECLFQTESARRPEEVTLEGEGENTFVAARGSRKTSERGIVSHAVAG